LFLGLLLLVAAGLKTHGLLRNPFGDGSFLTSAHVQVATIEIEVLLGLWLLTGRSHRWAWAAALVLFGVLAGVSLSLALAGQPACSCFGQLPVSPWVSFGIDVIAVAALLLWRPPRGQNIENPVWAQEWSKIGIGVCLLLVLVGGVLLFGFANPAEALAWIRNEAITVDPPIRQVGKGKPGEEQTFDVTLTNRTKRPIRLVGGTTTCACVATSDLPLTIEPGGTQTIEVAVRFVGSPGRFQRLFVLLTDNAKEPEVFARFSGEVIAPVEE
jgi:hypothetical protein